MTHWLLVYLCLRHSYQNPELSRVKSAIFSAFEQMEEKLDCRIPKSFVLLVVLFISNKGRINFLQLERFSNRCESEFWYFFERGFDFMGFNKSLIELSERQNGIGFRSQLYLQSQKKNFRC